MNQYNIDIKHLIFDLDGTLWDSRETIIKNWNLVLTEFGLLQQPILIDDMNKYMGIRTELVLKDMFKGISDKEISRIINSIGIKENLSVREHGDLLYIRCRGKFSRILKNL